MKRGQSAQLHCSYKLEGAPLYSVKWYRGNLEFYRYSPLEHPPAKIFPYTGIKVDVSSIFVSINFFLSFYIYNKRIFLALLMIYVIGIMVE